MSVLVLTERPPSPSSASDSALAHASEGALHHPANMDATCADVRDLRDPTSSHVVHDGCESPLSVGNALFDHLSPAAKHVAEEHCPRAVGHLECRRPHGSVAGVPEWWYWVGMLI